MFNGVTIDKTDRDFTSNGVSFKGTYTYQAFNTENKSILLVGGNNLYWPQSGASLGACRAYFQLADGVNASEFVLNFDSGNITGISEMRNEEGEMRNGNDEMTK